MRQIPYLRRAFLCTLLLCSFALSTAEAVVVYVNRAAPGPDHDGRSWDTAFLTVNEAVNDYNARDGEVWVARGIYHENVRFPTFAPTIALYGGFEGTEFALEQRNPRRNVTVLDGGGVATTITMDYADSASTPVAIVDGFTIRNGRDNNGGAGGGGLYLGNNVSAIITNNIFQGNHASQGGALISQSGAPIVLNNLFVGNAANFGAVAVCYGAAATFINNTMVNNQAETPGSVTPTVYFESSVQPVFANNILVDNSGGLRAAESAASGIRNNNVYNNTFGDYWELPSQTGENGNISEDPAFLFPEWGDYRLRSDSPGVDAGSNTDAGSIPVDLDGRPRIQGSQVDIGAYEYGSAPDHLLFVDQPGDALPGEPLENQPTLTLVDGDGFRITNFSENVRLSIEPGSGADGATLSGTTETAMDSEDISFSDLAIDLGGADYRLLAEADNALPAESAPFDVGRRVIYVKPNGDDGNDGATWATAMRTVQAAIKATASEVWVAAGTYTQNVDLRGGVALYGGFNGSETQRNQRNATQNVTILQGDQEAPVLQLAPTPSSGSIVVDGFTIRNGQAENGGGLWVPSEARITVSHNIFTSNAATGQGGAAASNARNAVFTDNTFTNNTAVRGGALYVRNATVRNNTFDGNTAVQGGAVVASDDVVLENNVFQHNIATANAGTDAAGGGLYVLNAQGSITDNTFTDNRAVGATGRRAVGGAIYITASSPSLSGNTLRDSVAQTGAGIAIEDAYYASLQDNTIVANIASADGGGVWVLRSPVQMVNNVLASNQAAGHGGGAALYLTPVLTTPFPRALVWNNTFAGNSAPNGGALAVLQFSVAQVLNNTFTGAGTGLFVDAGSTVRLDHNNVFTTGARYTGVADATGAQGNVSVDPLYVNAAQGDYHLQAASPLIDAGHDLSVSAYAQDHDGNTRIRGAHVDIGAYEAAGTVPNRLVFDWPPPTGGPAGGPIGSSLRVRLVGPNNVTLDYNGPVTLTLDPGQGTIGATLSGTITVNAVHGVATFTNLSVDKGGVNYSLVASAPDAVSAGGEPFTMTVPLVRVSPGGNDRNDGSSWASARKTVQSAILEAGAGEVWVAAGTYNRPLQVLTGASLYGGFAGTETAHDQRNPRANVTILDGNNANTTLDLSVNGANATVVDGFTIRNGNGFFGGVSIAANSPTLSNNIITANTGQYGTGGVGIFNRATPILRNNIIRDNAGEGVNVNFSGGVLANNLITGNGAGFVAGGSDVTLLNNTVAGNAGIGMDLQYQGALTLVNNIVAFNGTGVRKENGIVATLRNNDVFGNATANYSGLTAPTGTNGNISVDPMFANRPSGDYRLAFGSPVIDAGDPTANAGPTDLAGGPRVRGAAVDMGAYEYSAVAGFTAADAARALRLAAGLAAAQGTDLSRLNVEDTGASTGRIDMRDAARIARKAAGKDANP